MGEGVTLCRPEKFMGPVETLEIKRVSLWRAGLGRWQAIRYFVYR